MAATTSFVLRGPVLTGLLTTDGKTLNVAAVLAATLFSFTGSANGNGVTTLTNGSTAFAFTANQTLAAGTPIVFSEQPNVTYFLASAITAGTAGVLTQPYTGTSVVAASPATKVTNIMSATYTTAGGGNFTFTDATAQTLPIGFQYTINGGAAPNAGIVGTLTSAVSTDLIPTASVSYSSSPTLTNATLYTLVAAPAVGGGYGGVLTIATPPNEGNQDAANPPVYEIVAKNGSRTRITAIAWGNVAATDHVLVAAAGGTYTLIGADRQPVMVIALPPASLVA